MKLQEALSYMGWEKLPKAEKSSGNKCPVLVQRTTGEKDYAIANDFRIIADLNFKAGVVKILEYYPMHREEKQVKEEPVQIQPPPVKKPKREEMIEFLLSHKNKIETISKKTDKELASLCKIYGGNF